MLRTPYLVMVSSWVPQTWTIRYFLPSLASSLMNLMIFLAVSLSLNASTKLNIKNHIPAWNKKKTMRQMNDNDSFSKELNAFALISIRKSILIPCN